MGVASSLQALPGGCLGNACGWLRALKVGRWLVVVFQVVPTPASRRVRGRLPVGCSLPCLVLLFAGGVGALDPGREGKMVPLPCNSTARGCGGTEL
jgi:hypothetical protein